MASRKLLGHLLFFSNLNIVGPHRG
uniref:Uncharacterized protein n=1 Tax=Rhizophora mucronata TaxID=61149 RepID=A0A2P2NNP2_RHIMU